MRRAMSMAVIACGLLAQRITADPTLDELENTFPGHGSRITTRSSHGVGAPFRFRECILSVVGNHPIGGATNLVPVNI